MPSRRRLFAGGVLFALLVGAYAFSIDLRATRGASITGDEPFYLLTTQSLVEDGDLDVRNQYRLQSYREFFDHTSPLWLQSADRAGEPLLSPHEPGLALYLVPGFAVGGLRGAQWQLLATAALAWTLAYLLAARETSAPRLAWLATLALALTAPAFVYSTEVYPELPAALCVVTALLVLAGAPLGSARVLALAALVSVLPWLGTKYVVLAAVLGMAAVASAAPRQRGAFVGLTCAAGTCYVAWHLWMFGALTPYSVAWLYEGASSGQLAADHFNPVGRAYRLVGLFVDQRFGLGRWAPPLLLLIPALPLLLRRGRLAVTAAGLIGAQLLMAALVAITMMGWWFPGRTMIAVLPLAAWPLTEVACRAPKWARALGGLAAGYALALTVTLVLAARSGEVVLAVDPFELRSPLFRVPAFLFPDYRAWDAETIVTHLLWTALALAGAAVAAGFRGPLSRVAFSGRSRRTIRGVPSSGPVPSALSTGRESS